MFQGSSVALVTPMGLDGKLDLPAWHRLLDFHLTAGTDGVVVGGTTGESAALTDAELRQLIVVAREQIGDRMALIAGAGLSSTAATLERVTWISELGVDGLLIVTPAYVKPTQEGLYQHYRLCAERASAPVILYNVPGRTACDLLPATVGRLAELPRIVAIKEAVAQIDRIRQLCACTPHLTVLSGDDATACEAILAGAAGVISVTSNVAPQLMAEMIAAARKGDRAHAESVNARLMPLHSALFVEGNPIPAKWVLEQMGLIEGGIRLPLTSLSTEHHATLRQAMQAAGLVTSAP
jgi:4-hydroxy-tetrahydrodipicolinate synthase